MNTHNIKVTILIILIHSKTPSGCLKPQIIPNPIHTVFFLYILYTPFHLKEACYSFSLAYPNCQLHCSFTLGPLLSKIRVTGTQALPYHDRRSGETAAKWLTGGEHVQPGDAGQRDDSRPGRRKQNGRRMYHSTQNSTQCKSYELSISGICYLIFLDCGWPQVTETAEGKTTGKWGLQYTSNTIWETCRWLGEDAKERRPGPSLTSDSLYDSLTLFTFFTSSLYLGPLSPKETFNNHPYSKF